MKKRTRLPPPAPKPAPTPTPSPSNRSRALRAARGLVGIEVALPTALADAIRLEAAYQGLSVAGLVAGWATRIAARQQRRAGKPEVSENRQAKSKKG
jgi:hypothetical protein